MDKKIILLSGPPASGKDTITSLLAARESSIVFFKKHRGLVDPQNSKNYFDVDLDTFRRMSENGRFVHFHYRYGRGYGISKEELNQIWSKNLVPVIHTGKIENTIAIKSLLSAKVYSVLLWSSLQVLEDRLIARHKSEVEIKERTQAIKEEMNEWRRSLHEYLQYDLILHNTSPDYCVNQILSMLENKFIIDDRTVFEEHVLQMILDNQNSYE